MRIIPVEGYPLKTYSSPEEAIDAFLRHPLQAKARADTAKLAGTTIFDAYWTDTDHVICFSNGLLVHVFLAGTAVDWTVTAEPPQLDEKDVERIGAPPVIFRWPNGESQKDRSALAAARIGRKFTGLAVTDNMFLVYCSGVLIWHFWPVRDTDRDRPILNVFEDD